jgi:hypothetical protein
MKVTLHAKTAGAIVAAIKHGLDVGARLESGTADVIDLTPDEVAIAQALGIQPSVPVTRETLTALTVLAALDDAGFTVVRKRRRARRINWRRP